jgi:tRNA pseudouridine32 synthase/23S rRNA pseudouridine746 synthase
MVAPADVFPLRHGVGASTLVLPAGPWATLVDYLCERFPMLTREEIIARTERGEVFGEDGCALDPRMPFRRGQRIHYYRKVEHEEAIPFEEAILYRDDRILVADKPHFLPMAPVGAYARETLLARLRVRTGVEALAPMHRLDRETAGVVAFTVERALRGVYQRLFAAREVEKEYEAIAPVSHRLAFPLLARHRLEPDAHFMRMRVVSGAPNAETRIDLIETRGPWARYRLRPTTGKKHQLRVQMAALGLPIRGDAMYPEFRRAHGFGEPLCLLARRLAFDDPVSGGLPLEDVLRAGA